MRGRAVVACLVAVGCGGRREAPAPREPLASQHIRCTLRISQHGIYVDGEPRPRADAVAYCKGTAGGAVVVIDDAPTSKWDETAGAMVVVEDDATKAEWAATRSALQREGVRIYVRGNLCDSPWQLGCRPKSGPEPRPEREPHAVGIKDATHVPASAHAPTRKPDAVQVAGGGHHRYGLRGSLGSALFAPSCPYSSSTASRPLLV